MYAAVKRDEGNAVDGCFTTASPKIKEVEYGTRSDDHC